MAHTLTTIPVQVHTTAWVSGTPDVTTVVVLDQFASGCPSAKFGSDPNVKGSPLWPLTLTDTAGSTEVTAPFPIKFTTNGMNVAFSCLYTPIIEATAASLLATATGSASGSAGLNPTAAGKSLKDGPALSTGAVSGIGIGTFALGLAVGLAAALFWLFSRRRSKGKGGLPTDERSAMLSGAPMPPPRDESPSSHTQSSSGVSQVAGATVVSSSAALENDSPVKGASNEEIASELAFLGQLIKDHAENNYHLEPLDVNPSLIKQSLRELNLDESTQHQITILALEPQTRYVAIRHLLALSIFSALDMNFVHGTSLLPPGVAGFIQSLPLGRRDDLKAFTTALNKWRLATADLLLLPHDHETRNTTTSSTPSATTRAQIAAFQAALNEFLAHFAHQDSRAVFDQTKNLEGVLQECAAFGYALFAHPCLWRYTYHAGGGEGEGVVPDPEKGEVSLVVLPGLERLSTQDGKVLERVEAAVAPGVVRV